MARRAAVREPAVAGQFYPRDPEDLRRTVAGLTPDGLRPEEALAVIVPHAGYVYSGAVAAETFARARVPETAVVIGPNHYGRGAPLAVATTGVWRLPGRSVPIDEALARRLAASPPYTADHSAHAREHSIEVQLPFLAHSNPQVAIVPVCASLLGLGDCLAAAERLARTVRDSGRRVLLVASTDMSHYVSRQEASRLDTLALERVEALDPEGLYQTVAANRISMCGVIPTTIILAAAKALGATRAERARYTDSGETSGDTSQVVGYAGYVIRRGPG